MTKATDVMTPGVEFIDVGATVQEAARMLARDGIGAMPVCSPDGRLRGFVTDRDIVVKVVAAGMDASKVRIGDVAHQPGIVSVRADDSIDDAMTTMKRYQVRRIPVLDGSRVVGMISQADIARSLPPRQAGDLLAAISS
jgi:CBS domain-containing protein